MSTIKEVAKRAGVSVGTVSKVINNIEVKPTEIKEENSNTYDLQKELEAKFDELFGPIDDN